MEPLGPNAKEMLNYINEKEKVTAKELRSIFPKDYQFIIPTLLIRNFISNNPSSDAGFDYIIAPLGRDYIQCAAEKELKNIELTEHFQNVKRIDGNVGDLKSEIINLQNQLEEERKRAEKAEEYNKWFSVFITIFGAALSVWISTWVN